MTKKNGALAAIAAYALWGILPVYWKFVQEVPAFEILCHRMAWSFIFVVLLLTWRKNWKWLRQAKKHPRTLLTFLGTSCILALNWFIYIWAVNTGHILDTSLGYFINPLFSVFLGVIFLKERLRLWQGVAVGIAAGGVIYLTLIYGVFPWIAFSLAFTFGLYGLLRKKAALDAMEGISLEMAFLFLPAFAYLLYLELAGMASFGHAGIMTNALLAFAGVVTVLPLLLFTYAAKRTTLTTVGILQYITPTGQFLLGVLVYGEPFAQMRVIGFGVIWIALLTYSIEGMIERRKRKFSNTSIT